MSLFLGKIHYWLYNKILWFELTEEDIMDWAKDKGLPVEEWKKDIYDEFGAPTGGKPLEEIIDTSNIHGWLQQRIQSAESRQAALVTRILDKDPGYKKDLLEMFKKQGEKAAGEYGEVENVPEAVYNALNDFILEGMPCDRVNELVTNNENEYSWKTTACLHSEYWNGVKGNVQNFYDLREAWVRAFVTTINPAFGYEELPGSIHRITAK